MSVAVGSRLGPYEILAPLGAGGMGEVYKARDPRLNRSVAIKVLPAAAAADTERRARFEREAQAVAALNHPNIVTIHAVEEADGIPFFTMEYVEGRTLAQIIPPHGLPLDELLRIAIPLTDAVGAAHERGILHRDLKPANVMVTTDGRVKVLDFGLAKLKEVMPQPDGGSQATAAATGEGRILGTVAYMSPEQGEGKALDQRSDVFSLGILLYEMATGQRPFKGNTSVSVLSAILKDTPDSVTDLRPDLPRDLGKILKRALAKDPERRYQSAKDLRNDLESLKEDLDSGELARSAAQPAMPGLFTRHPRLAAGSVIAVIILVAAGGWWGSRLIAPAQPAPPVVRPFDEVTVTPLTTEETVGSVSAISPDGRYVAYSFVDHGREGLRVRQVGTTATVDVVPPADVQYNGLTFTPDGNRLAYITYPKGSGTAALYEVSVLGGAPRRLIEDIDCQPSYSPDGRRFGFLRGVPAEGTALIIANADGTGERTLVFRKFPQHFVLVDVAWSPDGRVIAAVTAEGPLRRTIVTVDAASGAVMPVGQKRWDSVSSLAWLPGRSALIAAAADYAVAPTPQLWEVTVPEGSARTITRDITGHIHASLTADGRTLVAQCSEWQGTLWLAPATQPDHVAAIGSLPKPIANIPIRWTPDGRLLYTAMVGGNSDVWSVRPDGSDLRQLTTSPALDGWAVASPDNRYIVFSSNRDDRVRVWRMDPDGSHQVPLTSGPSDWFPVVAADSKSVYYVRSDQPDYPLYAIPMDGGEPTLLSGAPSRVPTGTWAGVPHMFQPFALSPDGRLIAGSYWDQQEGQTRMAILPVGGQGIARTLNVPVLLDGSFPFAWTPDSRAFTFVRTTDGAVNLWRQPLDGGPAVRLTNYTSADQIMAHAWSRDGKWLAFARGRSENHVVMMKDVGRSR